MIGFSSAWAASRGRRALVVIVCLGVAWAGVGADAAVSADSDVELGLSQARPIPLISLSGERVRLGQILGDQLPRDGVVILVWSMYQPDSRRALRAVDQISGELSSPSSDIVFVAVEKTPPYGVGVYDLDPTDVERGRVENARAMKQLKWCLDNDKWPGYGNGITGIGLQRWARNSLDERAGTE